jgi:putative transposase
MEGDGREERRHTMDATLSEFLRATRDAREYKRALAVQMASQNYPYELISQLLQVSEPFVSKWKKRYGEAGLAGLRLGHRGSESYLSDAQRAEVLVWIAAQGHCDLLRLQTYLAETYAVDYQSDQSYYDLLHEAGLSWKKVQPSNPKKTTKTWQPNTPK